MNKKRINIFLLIVLAVVVVYFSNGSNNTGPDMSNDNSPRSAPSNDPNSVNALLTDEELVYTKHAKCRMECRFIDKSEVKDILYNGKVNWRKTKKNDQPCPSYALEGITKDGQEVRIVFADCNNATKVITAIDLGNEYDCVCD